MCLRGFVLASEQGNSIPLDAFIRLCRRWIGTDIFLAILYAFTSNASYGYGDKAAFLARMIAASYLFNGCYLAWLTDDRRVYTLPHGYHKFNVFSNAITLVMIISYVYEQYQTTSTSFSVIIQVFIFFYKVVKVDAHGWVGTQPSTV